jgi:pimeloyl-ACP methyl ester carboxylesterase
MIDRDRYLQSGSARLRFRDEGSGPPLVLIHGWALDMDMWEPQFARLSAGFRVIAFDRRGFGLSSGQPDVTEDVVDLAHLLDALAIGRCGVVGMSQGARVALGFASSSPARVSCLVLDGPPDLEPTSADDSGEEVPIGRYRELVQREGMNAFRQEWLRHPFTSLQTSDTRIRALLLRIVARYPGHDLRKPWVGAASAIAPGSEEPALPSVRLGVQDVNVPALVINGALDTALRRSAGAALAQRLSQAQHALIAAAGHLPNLDNPVAYTDLLARFLRTQEQMPASVARSAH